MNGTRTGPVHIQVHSFSGRGAKGCLRTWKRNGSDAKYNPQVETIREYQGTGFGASASYPEPHTDG
jgi:hypothetical protein